MLDMRLSHSLQPELLDELGDVVEPGEHIGGKLLELRVHHLILGFHGPFHRVLAV